MTDTTEGWQPGHPVITQDDVRDWRAWRRARALHLQRERRRSPYYLRVDYYAAGKVAAMLRGMVESGEAACCAHVIDRALDEWIEAHPELNKAK
jgi:hypothetical protein